MSDIRLDDDWQLTRAADGDAPVTESIEEFLQGIRLESMTQEGDLFYDPEYGWSLLDFIQREDNDLLRIEVQERIRSKMARHPEVDSASVKTQLTVNDDTMLIEILFRKKGSADTYAMQVALDRVRVEAVDI